jgi:hypothetical protein
VPPGRAGVSVPRQTGAGPFGPAQAGACFRVFVIARRFRVFGFMFRFLFQRFRDFVLSVVFFRCVGLFRFSGRLFVFRFWGFCFVSGLPSMIRLNRRNRFSGFRRESCFIGEMILFRSVVHVVPSAESVLWFPSGILFHRRDDSVPFSCSRCSVGGIGFLVSVGNLVSSAR